jgi:hypothetical protein
MSDEPSREMTLDEWVETLPKIHSARDELAELRKRDEERKGVIDAALCQRVETAESESAALRDIVHAVMLDPAVGHLANALQDRLAALYTTTGPANGENGSPTVDNPVTANGSPTVDNPVTANGTDLDEMTEGECTCPDEFGCPTHDTEEEP